MAVPDIASQEAEVTHGLKRRKTMKDGELQDVASVEKRNSMVQLGLEMEETLENGTETSRSLRAHVPCRDRQ